MAVKDRAERADRVHVNLVGVSALAMGHFLGGFLMSAGQLMGKLAPFGVAAVAAVPGGLNGASTLAGAALGYLVTGPLEWGIRYAAGCVVVFTLLFIFQDAKWSRLPWAAPLTAGLVMAATGLLGCAAAGLSLLDELPGIVSESALCAGGAFFFREALSPRRALTELAGKRHDAAVAILAACALMSLARIQFMGVVSLGRVLALLVVMTASLKGGSFAGAAAGTAFGLAMDASAGTAGLYTMAWAFSALCAGVFSRFGRLAFLSVFVVSDALAVYVSGLELVNWPPLFEAFAASVVFMLIPSGVLTQAGALVTPLAPGVGESGLRKYASRRVEGIARAYMDVCAVAQRGAEYVNDNDVARVFDRAAGAACAKCAKRGECWVSGYMETLDALNSATAAMNERGRLEEGDVPEWFRTRCVNMPAFVAAVNGELRALAYRAQYRERLKEGRAAAWGQYRDFAEILSQVSHELGSLNGADPLAERRLMRYLRTLDIEADAAVFRDSTGRLRAVIESGRLGALTKDPSWLDRLSAVLGVRLCTPCDGAEGRLTLLEAEPLCASVGIAALKKPGERVSGDRGTYFKTDAGALCVILSDGMGSGEDAAGESCEAVAILERFLRSGVDPAVAMKILNSVMLLRNGDEWGYATVDLMYIDLFTGEASFYKYGAAPSYVRSGKSVRRIDCESLAAGMTAGEGAKPDMVHMHLHPESVAVIASDGVVSGAQDGWLRSILADCDGRDMKALARTVLRRACEEMGEGDDMTVLAVRVDARA